MRQNATQAVTYDAAAFAQDANGRELQRGARVEILASGERGRVRDIDGNYVVVDEESGYSTRLAASGVKAMSNTNDTVAMATSAVCSYCSKRVSMSRSRLGDHRVPGGMCDGSGRAVASVSRSGAATFAQRAQTFAAVDSRGVELKVGDRVYWNSGYNGEIVRIQGDRSIVVYTPKDFSEHSVDPAKVTKA